LRRYSLRSITVSLLYLPFWLLAAQDLVLFRSRLIAAAQAGAGRADLVLDRAVIVFLVLSLLLPMVISGVWAVTVGTQR
jgi:hypothetical protein